jgi:hypothetical protein
MLFALRHLKLSLRARKFWVVGLALLTLVDANPALSANGSKSAEKRQKVIDFEDEVVEGMNRRRLRRKSHLYRKRGGFRSETAETLRALRYTP